MQQVRMCSVDLVRVNDHTERDTSSADEHRLSTIDEYDEYLKCAKHEESPLLHRAPSEPPVAISGNMESLLPGASVVADDGPQSALLAGHDSESQLNMDMNDGDEDDDDDDDGRDQDDDRRRQQTDGSDEEVYRAGVAKISNADFMPVADSPDDSAAETASNVYSMAAVSKPVASDSSSSSGGGYWQAQRLPDAGMDSSATSGMEDGRSLHGDSDESTAMPDGCDSPESDSGYCSVKFFTNAIGDNLPD